MPGGPRPTCDRRIEILYRKESGSIAAACGENPFDDIASLQGIMQEYRREFHHSPELSMQEFLTCKRIKQILAELGFEIQEKYTEPAVVGLLRGGAGPGPTLAFRADMDALPILEKTSAPYKSRFPGIMHASGHDAHMAILLGLAHLLGARATKLHGNVKLIFQPGEETPHPGGAFQLIQEGVLQEPKVDYIFAHHLHFALSSNSVCIPRGISMAATDDFELLVEGKCSPIAQPQAGVDAIVIAAQIVLSVQTLISRMTSPMENALLTIGQIRGGNKSNIIADTVKMTGTLRAMDESLRDKLRYRMMELTRCIAQGNGGNATLRFTPGYPLVVNDSAAAAIAERATVEALGEESLVGDPMTSLVGDDFAWYLKSCPGVIVRLGGCSVRMKDDFPLDAFDLDEDCLFTGLKVFAQIVHDLLMA